MFSNKDKEKQVVKDLVDYRHATHNTIVSNSVGMALLHLSDCYLSPTELLEREKEFESLYQRCFSQIKSNAPESGRADCAYLDSLTAFEVSELDTVTLFFKAQDYESTGNLYSERRIFPLKQVITLVWLALSDQNKYSVYLRAEDPEKRAESLKAHYKERLTSFYNCLALLNQSKICSHGVRNELVFLLNKSYPGIDLIEDSRAAVYYFLKESLLANFFKFRVEASELEQKPLLHAILIWMRDTNPKILLGIVDSEYTIFKELVELFLQHGSSPQEIKLEELIKEALDNLTFSCNKSDSTFYYLNLILQRPPLKQMHNEVKIAFDFVQNGFLKCLI